MAGLHIGQSPDIRPDILPLDYPAAAIALGPLIPSHINLSERTVVRHFPPVEERRAHKQVYLFERWQMRHSL